MRTCDIRIRDPFVLPVKEEKRYYLYGTTDITCWDGPGYGFDVYVGTDLEEWDGPRSAFRPPEDFWATTQFWAPEVHRWKGRYFMLATFKAPERYRGTQPLVANRPEGPYLPVGSGPITPPDWECLDGTLHVEEDGTPWLVFCHEWMQVHNGGMWAQPLEADLTKSSGRPVFLFNASEAPWVVAPAWPDASAKDRFPRYITDGPFLYRTRNGTLLMLWSSCCKSGYALGIARSESGNVTGPWLHEAEPLYAGDGGHGMLFRCFNDRLMLALHAPNGSPDERARFLRVHDTGATLILET